MKVNLGDFMFELLDIWNNSSSDANHIEAGSFESFAVKIRDYYKNQVINITNNNIFSPLVRFGKDGDQYYFGFGDLPNLNSVYGFGGTIEIAANSFIAELRSRTF